jgi:hypothetical protein
MTDIEKVQALEGLLFGFPLDKDIQKKVVDKILGLLDVK